MTNTYKKYFGLLTRDFPFFTLPYQYSTPVIASQIRILLRHHVNTGFISMQISIVVLQVHYGVKILGINITLIIYSLRERYKKNYPSWHSIPLPKFS